MHQKTVDEEKPTTKMVTNLGGAQGEGGVRAHRCCLSMEWDHPVPRGAKRVVELALVC